MGGESLTSPIELTISDEAFAYLKIQRGAISDISNDREAWERAYRRCLLADMGTMLPWLPERCGAILDVGSGLGGINILLSRHYGEPEIWLLDGEADEPVVKAHDQPFNDMDVAFRFLDSNDTAMTGYFNIGATFEIGLRDLAKAAVGLDLVISLQAWCFHFQPRGYLAFLKRSMSPGATLILDVRRDRDDWRDQLREAFTEVGIAHGATKFERVVFRND